MVRSPRSLLPCLALSFCLALPALTALKATTESVTLAWDASPSPNVVGYRLHYGFTNGVYLLSADAGQSTNLTVTLPVPGVEYRFIATAYDEFGRQSDWSNEATYQAAGEVPLKIKQVVETLEDEPVALPWGPDAGYTDDATWLIAIPPSRGWLTEQAGRPFYVPFAEANGVDGFEYFVLDGDHAYAVAATLTIHPVNDPPWAWESDVRTDMERPVVVTLGAWDPDGDALSFEVTRWPQHGKLSDLGEVRSYGPEPRFRGLDSFVYVAADGQARSEPVTVWLWVGMAAGEPGVLDLALSTTEDAPAQVILVGRDPEGTPLGFDFIEPPRHGTLTEASDSWVYNPSSDFNGIDTFSYRASDGQTFSAPATVRIEVTPVNDPPAARHLELETNEDQVLQVLLEGLDVDGDGLAFEVIVRPQHGTLLGEGSQRTYDPHPDFHGPDELLYRVWDGITNSEPATVQIVVKPVSDAPVAQGASYQVVEGLVRDFVLGAEDPDGDRLTFRLTQGPEHGTVSGTPPALRYQPAAGYAGGDRIEFVASDGLLDSPAATVVFDVLPKAALETTLTIKLVGEQLWLTWPVVPGAGYRLWYRAELAGADWIVLDELPPAEPGQPEIAVAMPERQGYYRLEAVIY